MLAVYAAIQYILNSMCAAVILLFILCLVHYQAEFNLNDQEDTLASPFYVLIKFILTIRTENCYNYNYIR